MVKVICNICGSDDINIKDESSYGGEVKSICNSCGNVAYAKVADELPITAYDKDMHVNNPIRRNRCERRHKNFSKAIRKRKLDLSIYGYEGIYKNLHQYSKNKIHCSCPLCSAKYKNSGGARILNPTISDLRKYRVGNIKRIKTSMHNEIIKELSEADNGS